MDAVSSDKHKHKWGITFVIVSRYHFRGNTVEATVPALLSPLLRYYRSRRFQYCGKSTVTAVFPSFPLPCSCVRLTDRQMLRVARRCQWFVERCNELTADHWQSILLKAAAITLLLTAGFVCRGVARISVWRATGRARENRVDKGCALSPENFLNFYIKMASFHAFWVALS